MEFSRSQLSGSGLPRHFLPFGIALSLASVLSCSSQPQPRASDSELAALREEGRTKGWTFAMDDTGMARSDLDKATGFRREWMEQELGGGYRSENQSRYGGRYETVAAASPLPKKWDWRWFGVVTEIRNQAEPDYCGSCWAFGSVASFESSILIKTGRDSIHIAEQQQVSCGRYGTCNGGVVALGHYEKEGAMYEADFPYQAADVSCKSSAPKHEKIADWGYVGGRNREPTLEEIKQALFKYGPLVATVAVSRSWSRYKEGIFNACDSQNINHIVAIVGWDDDEQVWIIKNSHGTRWGEQGYMRSKYVGENNEKCNGIGETAAFAIYEPEGQPPVN